MGQRLKLRRSQRAKNRVQQAALGGLLHNRNSCRGGVATVGASPTPSLDNAVDSKIGAHEMGLYMHTE